MLHTFLITLAIVTGILSPLLLLVLIAFIGNGLTALKEALVLKSVEAKMRPPYDTVEVSREFQTNGLAVRFIKKDEVIWQGNVTGKELREQ